MDQIEVDTSFCSDVYRPPESYATITNVCGNESQCTGASRLPDEDDRGVGRPSTSSCCFLAPAVAYFTETVVLVCPFVHFTDVGTSNDVTFAVPVPALAFVVDVDDAADDESDPPLHAASHNADTLRSATAVQRRCLMPSPFPLGVSFARSPR